MPFNSQWYYVETFRGILEPNGPYLADEILKCIFLSENMCTSVQIAQKCIPEAPRLNIGSGNALALSRQQIIICTNDDLI